MSRKLSAALYNEAQIATGAALRFIKSNKAHVRTGIILLSSKLFRAKIV